MKQLLSDGNKKYRYRKDIKVLTFGLPPIKTCPGAGWCKKVCYATQGRMGIGQAVVAQERRYEATKRDDFVDCMVAELSRRKSCNMVRIHDSGDFYSLTYLQKWVAIAQARPDITFFAYTKMVPMIQPLLDDMPHNLKLIFSYGGKWDDMIDPVRDYHSKVFETKAEGKRARYHFSPDNLPVMFHKNRAKEGFTYHGTKLWATCMKPIAVV